MDIQMDSATAPVAKEKDARKIKRRKKIIRRVIVLLLTLAVLGVLGYLISLYQEFGADATVFPSRLAPGGGIRYNKRS